MSQDRDRVYIEYRHGRPCVSQCLDRSGNKRFLLTKPHRQRYPRTGLLPHTGGPRVGNTGRWRWRWRRLATPGSVVAGPKEGGLPVAGGCPGEAAEVPQGVGSAGGRGDCISCFAFGCSVCMYVVLVLVASRPGQSFARLQIAGYVLSQNVRALARARDAPKVEGCGR